MPFKSKLLKKFLIWRIKHIPQKNFVYILAILTGVVSGIGAIILKNFTHYIQLFLENNIDDRINSYYYFVYPLVGILIVYVVSKFIIRKPIGHGIPNTLYSISKRNGIMRPYQMIASVLTAPFTVGFGGSVGLEGPTVATGASLGSNMSQLFHMDKKTRTLIIAAAACGAMSSIFKSPLAAIVFAIEVFSLDLTLSSLVPLLIASVSAFITSVLFIGDEVTLKFQAMGGFDISHTIYYILLGVFAGGISVYFSRVYLSISSLFEKINHSLLRALFGGSVIGILVFLIPPLYGEGFGTINSLLAGNVEDVIGNSFFELGLDHHWYIVLLILILCLLKIVASACTFGAGGVGGIFAPSLFMGSTAGFVFARSLNLIYPELALPETHFAMVGMGAVMSGVLFAPLTAIFLIAELTGGYALFVPLMMAAGISFSLSKYISKYSVYTLQLAKRGELLTHNKDKNILQFLKIDEVIETNFVKLNPSMTLEQLFKNELKKTSRNLFPVVNDEKQLVGILILDDFRHMLFDQGCYHKTVGDIMHAPPEVIHDHKDNMEETMNKFNRSKAWNLPVVSEKGTYLGIVSRSKMLTIYRKKLIELTY